MVHVYLHEHILFDVSKLLLLLIMPGNNVRLKERNTRRKITVRRKNGRSTLLVNQSIKNSLIQKMMQLKGEEERPVMKILTRSITRLNQIQSMNRMMEKGKEGRITTKTRSTEKDHPVITGGKAKPKTLKERITTKTRNTEKDHPIITGGKAKSKTIKKMPIAEITSRILEDMLQKVCPIMMPLRRGKRVFQNQVL